MPCRGSAPPGAGPDGNAADCTAPDRKTPGLKTARLFCGRPKRGTPPRRPSAGAPKELALHRHKMRNRKGAKAGDRTRRSNRAVEPGVTVPDVPEKPHPPQAGLLTPHQSVGKRRPAPTLSAHTRAARTRPPCPEPAPPAADIGPANRNPRAKPHAPQRPCPLSSGTHRTIRRMPRVTDDNPIAVGITEARPAPPGRPKAVQGSPERRYANPPIGGAAAGAGPNGAGPRRSGG